MDFSAIGAKIKDLRKLLGITQKELATGICTQAQISKIENGDVDPFASTIYQISQRLGVDVNYFFDISSTPRLDYIIEVSSQLQATRRNINYQEMKQIVKNEEKNPLFTQNKKNLQLLLWHKGIYEYHLNNNLSKSIQLHDEAISLTHNKLWTEREIEILLSKGIIFSENGNFLEAMSVYKPTREHLSLLPHLHDDTIKSRMLYNKARTLTKLEQYTESISKCTEAIKWCIEKDNLYLLGELHYHIGYNYEKLSMLTKAKLYMEKSLIIFELQGDTKYMEFIKNKINQW